MDLMAIAVTSEDISPEKYLKLTDSEKSNIESSKIVPASLGNKDFGKIRVNYKSPLYKVSFDDK